MKKYIEDRVLDVANYILETKTTVRKAAKEFGVSKSTIHKDMMVRLPEINQELAFKLENVLEFNKAERHLRGGLATKLKYKLN